MKPIPLVLALSVFVAACMSSVPPSAPAPPDIPPSEAFDRASVVLEGPAGRRLEVAAEVARTQEQQQRGLMFRTELPDGKGMLFIFEQERGLGFWMRNTLIPLDIVFFDAQGRFVSSDTMVPCAGDPCPVHSSAAPALYALEVPAGYVQREGVGTGWVLRR